MIRDAASWREWEERKLAHEPADYTRNLAIVEALYQEARLLGVFPLSDPMEGLEDKIRVAKILNARTSPAADHPAA
jgi:hypothetical protein